METPTPVVGLAAGGGIVLAAAGRAGLRVVDISTPTQPAELAGACGARRHPVGRSGRRPCIGRQRSPDDRCSTCRKAVHPVELGDLPLRSGPPDSPPSWRVPSRSSGRTCRPESRSTISRTRPPRRCSRSSACRTIRMAWTLPEPCSTPPSRRSSSSLASPTRTSPEVIGQVPAGEGGAAALVAADGGFVTVANSHCPWFPGALPTSASTSCRPNNRC